MHVTDRNQILLAATADVCQVPTNLRADRVCRQIDTDDQRRRRHIDSDQNDPIGNVDRYDRHRRASLSLHSIRCWYVTAVRVRSCMHFCPL